MKQAVRIVRLLQEHGIPAVIAGGAARDTLLGLTPKDYDIVVMADHNVGGNTLEILGDYNLKTYGLEDDAYTGQHPQASHLLWVFKLLDHAIDIIQQRHLPATAIEVVEGFDVSLNMAWFELHDGDNWVVAHHPTDFPEPGEMVKILRTCDSPATRIPYLAAKHPGYLWPDVSELTVGSTCSSVAPLMLRRLTSRWLPVVGGGRGG